MGMNEKREKRAIWDYLRQNYTLNQNWMGFIRRINILSMNEQWAKINSNLENRTCNQDSGDLTSVL